MKFLHQSDLSLVSSVRLWHQTWNFFISQIFALLPREAACNQSQLFPFIHDKIFVWIQKKESQGCHTAGNLSTIGFLLYDSALCLDPHMESSLTDFVYRALKKVDNFFSLFVYIMRFFVIDHLNVIGLLELDHSVL